MSLLSALAVILRLFTTSAPFEYYAQVSVWLTFSLYIVGYVHIAHPGKEWWRHHAADILIVLAWNPAVTCYPLSDHAAIAPLLLQMIGIAAHVMVASRCIRYRWGQHPFVASSASLLVVLLLGAALLRLVEPSTFPGFWTALWFAYETVTTLGYGDYVPRTTPGYMVAIVLSLAGTGLLATLTAYLGAHFIASVHWNPSKRKSLPEVTNQEILLALKELNERSARLEEAVAKLMEDKTNK